MLTHKEAEELSNLLQLLMASLDMDPCHDDELRGCELPGCTRQVSKAYVRKLTDYVNVHTVRAEPR